MKLETAQPWRALPILWETFEDAAPRLTIVAKLTCTLERNPVPVPMEEQFAVFIGEELRESKECVVKLESDAVFFKPRADVVLVGRAYAPGGRAATKMDVGVRVGRLSKTLRVMGDRRWWFPSRMALVPAASEPEPFTTMDLVYERAFGGADAVTSEAYPQNPTGRGFITKKTREAAHDRPLPNIEDPSDPVTSWDSRTKPAGFAFYGRGWMPRSGYMGTFDEKWIQERQPLLPVDFSYQVFNAAHPDLQVEGYLKGDEEVELRGVTPEGSIRFKLPGLRPRITVVRWTADPETWLGQQAAAGASVTLDDVPRAEEPAEPVLDTLVFLPEERLFYEVFRTVVPLRSLESPEIAGVRIETR